MRTLGAICWLSLQESRLLLLDRSSCALDSRACPSCCSAPVKNRRHGAQSHLTSVGNRHRCSVTPHHVRLGARAEGLKHATPVPAAAVPGRDIAPDVQQPASAQSVSSKLATMLTGERPRLPGRCFAHWTFSHCCRTPEKRLACDRSRKPLRAADNQPGGAGWQVFDHREGWGYGRDVVGRKGFHGALHGRGSTPDVFVQHHERAVGCQCCKLRKAELLAAADEWRFKIRVNFRRSEAGEEFGYGGEF